MLIDTKQLTEISRLRLAYKLLEHEFDCVDVEDDLIDVIETLDDIMVKQRAHEDDMDAKTSNEFAEWAASERAILESQVI